MESIISILIVIDAIIIIYVSLKYNRDEKCNNKYDIYRDTNIGISPIEAAYLLNRNANTIDLILAGVLDLTRKGYIELTIQELKGKKEYVLKKTKKEIDYSNLKKYEFGIYRLFFNEEGYDVIYLSEYLQKLNWDRNALSNLEVKMLKLKSFIDEEFINKGIEDKKAKQKMKEYSEIGKTFLICTLIIAICNFHILLVFKTFKYYVLIILLMSLLLILITNKKQRKITKYGDDLRERIKGIKRFLKEYTLIKERPIYTVKILEEKYIWGVALGIADLGESEFIKPVYNTRRIRSSLKLIIEVLIFLLLTIITLTNKELMKFIFIIIIIVCCAFGAREERGD